MEDSVEVILQDHSGPLVNSKSHPVVTACTGALFTGLYGLWSLFAVPGFRKVPWRLKCSLLATNVGKEEDGSLFALQ